MKILESYKKMAKSMLIEHAWERKFGEPLPTLEDTMKEAEMKLQPKGGGKTVTFKDKDNYEKAKKSGDYEDPEETGDDGGEEPSGKLGAGDFDRDSGDDGPKVPAPDSRSDTGKPRVHVNPHDDRFGQDADDTTGGDPDDSWDDEEGKPKPKSPEEWFGDDEEGLDLYGHEGAPESISDVQDLISMANPTGKWLDKAIDGAESGRIKRMPQSVLDSIKKAAANPKVHSTGPEGEAMLIKYFEDKIASGDIEIVKSKPKAEPKKKRKAFGTTRSVGYRGSNY